MKNSFINTDVNKINKISMLQRKIKNLFNNKEDKRNIKTEEEIIDKLNKEGFIKR